MNKKLLFLVAAACAATAALGQNVGTDYRTAAGIWYYPAGITLKRFVGRHIALEGIGYLQHGFRLTVLAEYHGSLGKVPGLNWFAGPGLHSSFRGDRIPDEHPGEPHEDLVFGADGIVGIDYKVRGAPVNLSFAWQPAVNLAGVNYFEARHGGLGIRYAF
ncbi:hypothetical protein [Flaviaesturariibacter terrae]